MNQKTGGVDLNALRELYSDNDFAKAILDDFAGRTNNQRIIRVDQITTRLRATELPCWSVIKLFRGLNDLGHGRNCSTDGIILWPVYRKPFDMIFNRPKTEEWCARKDSNLRPFGS